MAQLTEEDLKNMSPEELRELQKQNCIFCHIASGKVPAKKIYEDDKVLAILDINPAKVGHILLLPKEHYALMPMVPDDIQKYMFMVGQQIAQAMLKGLKVSGTNMFLANGAVAGQRAPHVIMHIVPRSEDDGLTCFDIPKNPIQPGDLKKIQLILRKSMSQMMKVDDPELEKEIEALNNPQPAPVEQAPEPEKPVETEETPEFKNKTLPPPTLPKEEDVDLDSIANMFK